MAGSARIALLIEQLDAATDLSTSRLEGLTDEEYLWEPAQPAWSIRPRGEAVSKEPLGTGDWQRDSDLETPQPGPVTTIGWRLGHLTGGLAGRWELTFGSRQIQPEDLVDYPALAADGVTLWQTWLGRWRSGLATVTDEQADQWASASTRGELTETSPSPRWSRGSTSR